MSTEEQDTITAAAALLAKVDVQSAQDKMDEPSQPKLDFMIDTTRHVVVHIRNETSTVMKLLQTTLLENPTVVYASYDIPDQVNFAVLKVDMASTGKVSAKAAIVKALLQMRQKCRDFSAACKANVPNYR